MVKYRFLYAVGAQVSWVTTGRGSSFTTSGTVIAHIPVGKSAAEVCPRKMVPKTLPKNWGMPRTRPTYIVREARTGIHGDALRPKLYFPFATAIEG